MTSNDMCALCKSLNVLQDLRSSRNLCVQAWWLVGREGVCVWLQKCNPSECYESYENSRRKVGARSLYILDRFEQRQTYSSGNTRRTEAIASNTFKYQQYHVRPNLCAAQVTKRGECWAHRPRMLMKPSKQLKASRDQERPCPFCPGQIQFAKWSKRPCDYALSDPWRL